MARPALLCVTLGLLICNTAALDFTVSTPPDEDPTTPDMNSAETLIATAGALGSQVISEPGTELILFGLITPDSAAAALGQDCGGLTAGSPAEFKVTTDKQGWGDTEGETGSYTIIQTSGCEASSSPDGSLTEITFKDPNGRQELILCGDDAEDNGCGWWWLGEDVKGIEDALAAAPADTGTPGDSSGSPPPTDGSSPSPGASPPPDAASPPPSDGSGAPPAASGGRKMLQTTTVTITISISNTVKPEVPKPKPSNPDCKPIQPGTKMQPKKPAGSAPTNPFSGKGCITPNTAGNLGKKPVTPNPTPTPKGAGLEIAPGIFIAVINVPKQTAG